MENRQRLLLYWGYHRESWIAPFLKLQEHFEIYFIFHYNKADEFTSRNNITCLYFKDFSSAQELIRKIRPTKIVFFGLEGLLSMSINMVARQMNIPTLLVQHGFLYTYEDLLKEEKQERLSQNNIKSLSKDEYNLLKTKRLYYLKFSIRSLGLTHPFFLFRFFILKLLYRHSHLEMLRALKSRLRLADRYLLYAPYFKDKYEKRDHIHKDLVRYFGNPEADQFYDTHEQTNDSVSLYQDPYLLHIDQPILHAYKLGHGSKVSNNMARKFYLALNDFALDNELTLKIKLHPYSYESVDLFPNHPNIIYIKDCTDLPSLVLKAKFVTGFYSTLVLPAILHKNVCLFEITEGVSFVQFLKENGVCTVLKLEECIPQKLNQAFSFQKTKENIEFFKAQFFSSSNLSSIQRLLFFLKE